MAGGPAAAAAAALAAAEAEDLFDQAMDPDLEVGLAGHGPQPTAPTLRMQLTGEGGADLAIAAAGMAAANAGSDMAHFLHQSATSASTDATNRAAAEEEVAAIAAFGGGFDDDDDDDGGGGGSRPR